MGPHEFRAPTFWKVMNVKSILDVAKTKTLLVRVRNVKPNFSTGRITNAVQNAIKRIEIHRVI